MFEPAAPTALYDSLHEPKSHHEIVSAWVQGWTHSRRTAPPTKVADAYRIDVGLPDHLVRYVLPHLDPVFLHGLTQELSEPGTWLKICAEPGVVAPLLPRRWIVKDPVYLMTTTLKGIERPSPPHYRLKVSSDGTTIDAKVLDKFGELAASGRIAINYPYAVVDQVVTDPSHQRRGLGRFVMGVLGHYAAEQGASNGVLVATEDGRALYQTLGWSVQTVITSAVIDG